MKLEFEKKRIPCLRRILRECQTQEQTQELRLPEEMPDVGLVVGCWGQVILRTKEWRSESVGVSGGVMARVLYIPEGGGAPQSLETWLPFQMKWTIDKTPHDGTVLTVPFLRSADARSLSSRKLMVRTNVGVQTQAWVCEEAEVYSPDEVPEDVMLKKDTYLMLLPKEAGERDFTMEETLQMGTGEPQLEQVMQSSIRPEILETKLMGDKVIFRGTGIFHILYRATDGQLYSRDFDVPFSQYAELEGEYMLDASVKVIPVATNLEAQILEDGQIHMKAGILGQYMIWQTEPVEVIEDAYSPSREVSVLRQPLQIPSVLEMTCQTHQAKVDFPGDIQRCAEVTFLPEQPITGKDGQWEEADLTGVFQVLYYDPEGQLYAEVCPWKDLWTQRSDENVGVEMLLLPSGRAQANPAEAQLQSDIVLESVTSAAEPLQAVAAMELGEPAEPDPKRPSLILQRAGKNSLWELAKATGSTVESIMAANQLETDPYEDQMLLIPIP